VTYDLKDDAKCRKAPDRWTDQERADCIISPDEEWVVPATPFGLIRASGDPSIRLSLNSVAAARLTPGSYVARVKTIFDNGNQDEIRVLFNKSTPSGEYTGQLNVRLGGASNVLNGSVPLLLTMKLNVKAETTRWNQLLAAENIAVTETLTDITEGFIVHGYLHGNEVVQFALPGAASPAANEIPVKGIYSPRFRQMRLVGVMDIPADFCVGQRGSCADYPDDLQVRNLFGRDLRRLFQFTGSFDDTQRRFVGIYRETIYGLTPQGELTLDGAFMLSQKSSDEADLTIADPLLASGATAVSFPSSSAVISQINADIATYCPARSSSGADAGPTVPAESTAFASRTAYADYLSGRSTVGFPVFPDILQFSDLIQEGLDNLTADATRGTAVLTLYEYLSGRVVLCGDETSSVAGPLGTQNLACVDEDTLRCGLALYRKAILGTGYIDGQGITGSNPVFCRGTMPTEGCNVSPVENPALRTYQEHNRFHQELAQATKFFADRKVSDAFFAMYRNRVNPFTQGQALAYKADQLKAAAALYDKTLEMVVGSQAASVLFTWPMGAFMGYGREWVKQMHVLAKDRMDGRVELVDLRRRLFLNSGPGDQVLAEHLAQQEYLLQVYFMALQQRWEGSAFAYAGEGQRAIDSLQTLLARLQDGRNALGIVPERVFFESSDPALPNWRHYLKNLVGEDGEGGLVAKARQQVDDAVTNLQASLVDADALEDAVFAVNNDLGGALVDLCGSDTPKSCTAMQSLFEKDLAALLKEDSGLTAEEREALTTSGATAQVLGQILERRLTTTCTVSQSESCKSAVTTFRDLVNTNGPSCPLDAAKSYVMVRGKKRPCVGGQMGGLLLERESLLQERQAMLRELDTMLKNLQNYEYMRWTVNNVHIGQRVTMLVANLVSFVLLTAQKMTKTASEVADEMVEGGKCMLIAGLAVGTDCPQSIGVAIGASAIKLSRGLGEASLEALKEQVDALREITEFELDQEIERQEAVNELKGMLNEFDAFVDAYRANLQALYGVQVGMEEVRFLAQDAVNGANDSLTLLINHLVGRESGSVLVGNHLVGQSAKTYRKALDVAYRMTVAFAHRNNLSKAARTQLTNAVLQAVTLEDLQEHIDNLVAMDSSYCAREAIDCDAFNNLSTLRFSLRDELFPQLRDIVDPQTGAVLTRGEQFHNTITSPPYLRRRVRGAWLVDQVELPFAVSLSMRDNIPPRRWLLNPTECNHVIDGDPSAELGSRGTVAVNFVVRQAPASQDVVQFELARGARDEARSCYPEAVSGEVGTLPRTDYPISATVVGYAPESLEGQQSAPRSFYVRSAQLAACIRRVTADGSESLSPDGCWRFFARDRTLAAPDYTLYVPLRIGDADTVNSWLVGEGLPAHQKPIIEDIVLFIRYKTRPISDRQ
jgi:hypothetical protein